MATENLHLYAKPIIFENAKKLRKEQTKAEKILWNSLRNRKLLGFKFRRQHPIYNFVADFYCHKASLIIELDGSIHDTIEQKDYDKARSEELKGYGIRILRFTNDEIEHNFNKVLKTIKDHLTPLLQERGPGVR